MSSNTYQALVCCRAGVASSQMLKIKCDQVISEEGYPIETRTGTIADIDSFAGDLAITMSDLAEYLEAHAGVAHALGIRDIVNKQEIKDKLQSFLEAVGADQ